MKRNCFILAITLIVTGLLGAASMSLAQGGIWEKKAAMPTARYELSAAAVNNQIYAIGGFDGEKPLPTVEAYNPTTDKWTKKADIPTKRILFSTAVVGGKIYAFGGSTQVERRGKKIEKTVTAIEVYDPAADAWQKIGDAPLARTRISSVALNGKIYVIGGTSLGAGGGVIVEAFDLAANTWAEVARLNETRWGQTAGTVNGKIYAIGGYKKDEVWLKTVEEYDPATDTWQFKKEMPTQRNELSPTTPAVNGKFYVIGGEFENLKRLRVVEEYAPAQNAWKTMVSMPTPRRALAVAAVNGKLYAIGGAAVSFAVDPAAPPFSTVEEYAPPGWPFAVEPQGKLAATWGTIKTAD